MEVTGSVFGQVPCCFKESVHGLKQQHRMFCRTRVRCCDNGFSDKSHVEYYNGGTTRMEVKVKEEKKELKKKMKLLKGLSKNLGMFSEMGFGLSVDGEIELDQKVKGQMISEATDVLVAQLQKLKAEKMESKRIKKEEKAKKKAAKMMMMECKESSSESSSSSESDCDNVMNMKEIKTKKTLNTCQETPLSLALPVTVPVQISEKMETKVIENAMLKDLTLVEEGSKKIEVCMGGKCKKSGAAMLMENFQKAVGEEVAVVGCKCMGKCKEGPNVRVRSEDGAMANPLCTGVGLEDVDTIVANFLGEGQRLFSVMVPALSSV